MNPKPHLIAVLIFTVILLSGFFGNAQNSSDTIRIVQKGLGYAYYKDNAMLNFKQVMDLTKGNKEARYLLEKSNNMRNASYVFGIAGGGCLGYSLGYALGAAMFSNSMNKPLFFSLLGAGAVLTGVGIGFEIGANNKAREGVEAFNSSIKQKNSTNLDVGFYSNGMILKLNF